MTELDETTFEAEVLRAGDNLSPVRAGLLLARECAYPRLLPSDCLIQLDDLGAAAAPGLEARPSSPARGLALAEFLFQTAGFRGNDEDYEDPRNSYLNEVLGRRLGLPITLSVVFLHLAERLGVPAKGVGLPGHFIVSLPGEAEPIYIDPFNSGRQLTLADCAKLVPATPGRPTVFDPRWLSPTPPRDIVVRMLNNLRGCYVAVDDWPLAIKVIERLSVLQPEVTTHIRDLGILHYRNGALGQASQMLTEYLRRSPSAADGEAVRKGRDHLREELARLN